MNPGFWLNIIFIVIGGELIVESLKYLFSGKMAFVSEGKIHFKTFLVALICLMLMAVGGWIFWYGLAPLLDNFL